MPYHLLIFWIRNAVRETATHPKVHESGSTSFGRVTCNVPELDSDCLTSSWDLGSFETSIRHIMRFLCHGGIRRECRNGLVTGDEKNFEEIPIRFPPLSE